MIEEIAHFMLILALYGSLAQGFFSLSGAHKNSVSMMRAGRYASITVFALTFFSFLVLILAFVNSNFSLSLVSSHSHTLKPVSSHSHTLKPLLYKISGVWANHEGSMLLWTLILTMYGALISPFGKNLPLVLKSRAIGIQGLLAAGFLAFILFTSNPFHRINPVPVEGLGLNPLLQDPGLAIHPPILYLGYVGFSVAFSFSVAALIEGKVDAIWANWLRPWVLASWSFLTLGITLGSIWAYYELGWGGWWMWDPVENVSFMPWLAGTALLHSIMALGIRHKLADWTVLLGISTFSLCLIGTFVVRSGVLVSVHSFATDPTRGIFLLMLLVIISGSSLSLYAFRSKKIRTHLKFEPFSREGGLIINNLLLVISCITVFIGTFYPLFIDALSGDKISVGKPYFDLTFTPIMILLILFMGAAPLIKWNKNSEGQIISLLKKLIVPLAIMVILTFFIGKSIWGALGLALAAYLAITTLIAIKTRTKGFKSWKSLKPKTYSFAIAHLGVSIFAAGVVFMSVWSEDNIGRINVGEKLNVADYSFKLSSINTGQRKNYEYLNATIDVTKKGSSVKTLSTEQRFYPARNMVTTEAGFNFTMGPTVFTAISEGNSQDGWVIRANYHPFVTWIWLGALFMSLAGFISLFDKSFYRSLEML